MAAVPGHYRLPLEFSKHGILTVDLVDLKIADAQSFDPVDETFNALCDFYDAPSYPSKASGWGKGKVSCCVFVKQRAPFCEVCRHIKQMFLNQISS